MTKKEFIKDIDYYLENGFVIFTQKYLKEREYCCGNGCRHCPYEHIKGKYPQIDANIRNCVRNEDNK